MSKRKAGSFIPLPAEPIVLVGANIGGRPNFMAAGFAGGVNHEPEIICVSLSRKHHTPIGIIENGTFSVNVPSIDYVVETDYCGLVSGRDVDKSKIFTVFYGELGTAPMIEEFPIVCECRYTGQRMEFTTDIAYFGEVVQVHVEEDLLTPGKKAIDAIKARAILYDRLDNTYRAIGDEVGKGWASGREYGA
jgi:flavin reductase (DIM6/NTAB) family NADH-FMN oxidoreductase RutF